MNLYSTATQVGQRKGDDDRVKAERPGVPMELNPEDVPHVPIQGRQTPRVRVLKERGRQALPPVLSNAQPPRGLAGVLRRRAFIYPEHLARHWLLLLTADRVEVAMFRLKRRLGRAVGVVVGIALTRALWRQRK